MLEMEVARTADVIAREINDIKQLARETMVDCALQIGERLIEAKTLVPVGRWGEWLKTNVDYSERTAQNLMRLYGEYGNRGIPEGLLKASYTNVVALLGLPEDIKAEVIESGAAESLSARELEAEIKRLKAQHEQDQTTMEALKAEAREAASERDRQEGLNEQLKANGEELRAVALEAHRKAMEADEARKRAVEALKEIKEAQAILEPAVVEVEKIPENVQRELAELRARAKEAGKGQNEVLFFDATARLMEDYRRCVELIEETERESGQAVADRLAAYLFETTERMRKICAEQSA